jgi:CHAT domain-containing protein
MPALRKAARALQASLLALATVCNGCARQDLDLLSQRHELAAALSSQGWPAARFTGLPPPDRDLQPTRLRQVARQIQRDLAQRPTAGRLAEAGLLQMAAGKLANAEDLFTAAADRGDAPQHSDLGAFLLARASRSPAGGGDDLVRSLEASNEALARAPRLPAALFNRALALEQLGLLHQAAAAWELYLDVDSSSGWSATARRGLERMRQALDAAESVAAGAERRALLAAVLATDDRSLDERVRSSPEAARLYGLEVLLGAWAAADRGGNGRLAAALLHTAERLGAAVCAAGRDCLLRDSVGAIEKAELQGRDLLRALRGGHLLMREGLALEQREEYGAAGTRFAAASAGLRAAGSPFALLALLHQGVCRYYAGRYAEALALFAQARKESGAAPYPTVAAYCFWMSGVVHFAANELFLALADHRAALRIYTEQRETSHIGFTSLLVAVDLFSLGEPIDSWQYRQRALRQLPRLTDPRRIYSVLWSSAEAATDQHRPAAARDFLSELLAILGTRSSPGVLAEALARRGIISGQLGLPQAAAADFAQARQEARRIPDAFHRLRVTADLDFSEASASGRQFPRRALALLESAIGFYAHAGYRIDLAAALRERAAAHRAAHDPERAIQDLNDALADYEAVRAGLGDESSRIAYFEQARSVVEDLVQIELDDQHNPADSFLAADRARARGLLDHLSQDPAAAGPLLELAPLQNALGSETRLVEFAELGDRTLAWVLGGHRVEAAVLPVGAARIETLVGRFRAQLASGAVEPPSGFDLYQGIISPLRPFLTGVSAIVFVPDRNLARIPFAALQDPASRRYLLEDFTLSVAPSAAVYLEARERAADLAAPRSLLLVEGDAFDRRAFPGLAPLLSAAGESAGLSRLYIRSSVLQGSRARKRDVLAAMAGSDVIQITAHAVPDPEVAGSAALLVAPTRQGGLPADSLLAAKDVAGRRLPRTRLVILAACDTAAGAAHPQEGALSLGRSFLAAGVPAVVATLLPVDDAAAAHLLAAFHRNFLADQDAPSALRAAQLAFVHADPTSSPALWAALEVIGAAETRAARAGRRRDPSLL